MRQREDRVVSSIIASRNIVFATCVGAASEILKKVNLDSGAALFDLAIVDEAAQSLEVACWIPLLRARRAVLAGDHCQVTMML